MKRKTLKSRVKRQPYWLTQEHMVKSCRISPTGFAKWGVEPVARIGRHAFFEAADVIENRVANAIKRIAEPKPEPIDPADIVAAERDEKLRLTRAQAEGQELKNAQTRRELAPIQLIEYVVAKAGAEIAAVLDALPMQLKKRNPRLTATDIQIIQREIAKARNVAAAITVDLDQYEGAGD